MTTLMAGVQRRAERLLRNAESAEPYAEPRTVSSLNDCYFYHTMDIPGHGRVTGQWDLRGSESEYTGGVDFRGQRVLEVGTASGLLCFYMESEGAEVVAFDLSEKQEWDLVPLASLDFEKESADRRKVIREINNGWWLCRRAFGSRAKVVYGTVYDIPATVGPVDVATYCSVLLHFRDPFLALYNGLRLTRSTVVVTDLVNPRRGVTSEPVAAMEFVPQFEYGGPPDSWWFLTPEIVQQFVGVLGFEETEVHFHKQKASWGDQELFTVVGHRTRGQPVGA